MLVTGDTSAPFQIKNIAWILVLGSKFSKSILENVNKIHFASINNFRTLNYFGVLCLRSMPKYSKQGHCKIIIKVEFSQDNLRVVTFSYRICVNPFNYCSTCLYCVRGDTQFCIHEGIKTAIGIMKDGGFQKYLVVPGTLCFKLPKEMSLQESVFCQPLSNCMRGWDNMTHVDLEARILVAGAGI